jgi:chromosomal replication initiation ATPase DnaA
MAQKNGSEQLPLEFSHEAQTSRDDLLVSAPLDAAVDMIERWPNWPSPVVILAGPVGSGKSHLANIWREMAGATDIRPAKDASAAETASRGPVLFEDADRIPFDDTELFHVINAVREHRTSLLMTSRSWPSAWAVELADLKSRLKAATVVEIGEPDEELLSQVLVKLFADRQLFIDDRIITYIAERMERSLDAARRIVESLDRLALSRGVKVSRQLAGEVLASMQQENDTD